MARRLDGKVALITGGAGGPGFAYARRFVAEGARVVIADVAVYTEYYRAMERLAAQLMRAFALALGLPEEFFRATTDRHISGIRVINYPDQAHPRTWSAAMRRASPGVAREMRGARPTPGRRGRPRRWAAAAPGCG